MKYHILDRSVARRQPLYKGEEVDRARVAELMTAEQLEERETKAREVGRATFYALGDIDVTITHNAHCDLCGGAGATEGLFGLVFCADHHACAQRLREKGGHMMAPADEMVRVLDELREKND